MESYTEIKKRHSDEFGNFPICFAFSEKQLQEALEKLGASQSDCVTIGSGSILRKSDLPNFKSLRERHESEMKKCYESDDFLIQSIIYELGNHEYGYTWDASETIDALGLDMDDNRTKSCFQKAKNQYLELNADNF